MRSSVLLTTAFAAAAVAGPVLDRRSEVIVTTDEVVYTTEFVTVTAGQAAPSSAAAAANASGSNAGNSSRRKAWKSWLKKHGKNHPHPTGGYGSAPAPSAPQTSASAPAPTTEAPAPTSYSPPAPSQEPTTEAPAPEPTTEAPAPTATSAPAPPPSSSEAPAPAPTSPPPSGGVATTYQQAVVNHHNYHRANHSSPDIKWSESLASTAMKIAQTCNYGHSMNVDGGGYGQNIAAGYKADNISGAITDSFYNGEVLAYAPYYDTEVTGDAWKQFGHMSQVVWAGTTDVGCATYDCTGKPMGGDLQKYGNLFTVCNYSPPGNMMGAWTENVGASKKEATILGSYNVDCDAIASSYTG